MREDPWEKCEYDSSKLFELEVFGGGFTFKPCRKNECRVFQETGNYYLYLVWGINPQVNWKVVYETVEQDTITNIIMASIYKGKVYLLQIRSSTEGVRDAFAYARFEFLSEGYQITQQDNPIQLLQNKLKENIMEFDTPEELDNWYEHSVHWCSGERYTELFGELFVKVYRNGEWVYEHLQG